jgi:hypothetical protein
MIDNLVKELGLQVQLLTSFVEDLMRQVADIYKELDMVDEEEELTGYDLCECPPQYGHLCQDMHRV